MVKLIYITYLQLITSVSMGTGGRGGWRIKSITLVLWLYWCIYTIHLDYLRRVDKDTLRFRGEEYSKRFIDDVCLLLIKIIWSGVGTINRKWKENETNINEILMKIKRNLNETWTEPKRNLNETKTNFKRNLNGT